MKNTAQVLPGDLSPREQVERAIRVNQAGEYGAKRIYEGQLAVLKGKPCYETVQHMKDQEQVHLDTFNDMIVKRRVRPTVMTPIWHIAGYALGAGTALLGEKAAMACTVAVESVIEKHYAEQLQELGDDEKELKGVIKQFRDEEIEHHDIGIEHKAEEAPAYALLSAFVRAGTKLAIEVSKRV